MVGTQNMSGKVRTDLSGHTVLLVEDNFTQALDVQQALEGAGARVIGPFADTLPALRCIANQSPSCAILDIRLSDGVRFNIAAALQDKGIPFVFLSALHESSVPDELASAPFLHKPVDHRALMKVMAELSDGRSA